MKRTLIFSFIILTTITINACNKHKAAPLLWDIRELENVRSNPLCAEMKEIVLWRARKYSKQNPLTIIEKKKYFTNDKHYYQSLAIYFWPDSTRTDGKYRQRDGIYNPEYIDYDYTILMNLAYVLKYMSAGFYITREQSIYNAAIRQLKAWFIDVKTYMYPNFEYSQVMPGINNNQGRAEGLIDAYVIHGILEAIRLLNYSKTIDKETMEGLLSWFERFQYWLINSEKGKRADNFTGNHAVNYDLLLYDISAFIGDKKTCKRIVKDFSARRLQDQIDEEGKQPHEIGRTRSFFYQIYNITHILDLCEMSEKQGRHLYKFNKEYIERALKFLDSYRDCPQEYPYKELDSWTDLFKQLDHQIERAERLSSKRYFQTQATPKNIKGTTDIIL